MTNRTQVVVIGGGQSGLAAGDRLGVRGPGLDLAGGVAAFAASYGLFAVSGTGLVVLAVPFLLAGVGIGAVETGEAGARPSPPWPQPTYAARRSACRPPCSPWATLPLRP